jgi:lipid A ethanolaminephosphotransferase
MQSSWKTLSLLFLILIGFYLAISPFHTGKYSTLSLNSFFHSVITGPIEWTRGYHGPRESVPILANARPQNNIILIVDESVRGDHLSVNGYTRQTTPHLEQLQREGWLQTWGVAASGTNCSKTSNDLLLTGMLVSELPDEDYQIRRRPSIFQYARAMGYRTHYFDAQRDGLWLGTSYDLDHIDNWVNTNQLSGEPNERDATIGRRVAEIVGSSTGNFIWINKRGVHYPYANKYPPSEAHWQPSMTADNTQIDPARREELINSYDNALRYNLESFFRALDVASWRDNVFAIYTSDHGQSLTERGEYHMHCRGSVLTAPAEASVPLLLITKAPISVDVNYLAAHANILPTLLDLMGFPDNERRYQYSISLLRARASQSQPRYFYAGDLHRGRSLYRRLRFDN